MKRLATFKTKVTSVLEQMAIPLNVYAATAHDVYRKPRTGMWQEMLEEYDLGAKNAVDLEGSFFVGDAGGRSADDGAGKDHACSDRDFAANVGITFQTPEEFFSGHPPKPFLRAFDPTGYLQPSGKDDEVGE
ncbi:MAG: hypothetical protein M1817_003921 [Caeruleum heppii]|nr:MAG: hypothetical protein M1817_003921 [Caeruleum heppii]